jgi:hypothetical protein
MIQKNFDGRTASHLIAAKGACSFTILNAPSIDPILSAIVVSLSTAAPISGGLVRVRYRSFHQLGHRLRKAARFGAGLLTLAVFACSSFPAVAVAQLLIPPNMQGPPEAEVRAKLKAIEEELRRIREEADRILTGGGQGNPVAAPGAQSLATCPGSRSNTPNWDDLRCR